MRAASSSLRNAGVDVKMTLYVVSVILKTISLPITPTDEAIPDTQYPACLLLCSSVKQYALMHCMPNCNYQNKTSINDNNYQRVHHLDFIF